MLKILALSVVLAASATAVASADVVFNLQNVGFSDGGVATGTLTVASSGALSDFDVTTSGGDTASLPAFTYNEADASEFSFSYAGDLVYVLAQNGTARQLRLPVSGPLSADGGTYTLTTTDPFATECFNCYPSRSLNAGGALTSGEVAKIVTAVPEPASLAILGTGLIGLGLVRRRRR